jgi:hypothetical protein
MTDLKYFLIYSIKIRLWKVQNHHNILKEKYLKLMLEIILFKILFLAQSYMLIIYQIKVNILINIEEEVEKILVIIQI